MTESTAPQRPWTPERRHPDGGKTIVVKTACTACGRLLGDATGEEIERAIIGLPLLDTRSECGCEKRPRKFRHLPVEIEAMQYTADSAMEVLAWVPADRQYLADEAGTPKFYLRTPDGGRKTVYLGDWIVRDEFGDYQHMNSTAFERRYELRRDPCDECSGVGSHSLRCTQGGAE